MIMTKKDLKTGMIAECRNGSRMQVSKDNCQGIDALFGHDAYTMLDYYNEDMTTEYIPDMDIMRVYAPIKLSDMEGSNWNSNNGYNLLWERKNKF